MSAQTKRTLMNLERGRVRKCINPTDNDNDCQHEYGKHVFLRDNAEWFFFRKAYDDKVKRTVICQGTVYLLCIGKTVFVL